MARGAALFLHRRLRKPFVPKRNLPRCGPSGADRTVCEGFSCRPVAGLHVLRPSSQMREENRVTSSSFHNGQVAAQGL